MKEKRINLFIFLPNFKLGGAGNAINLLCRFLNKKKFNIFIISIGRCYYKNSLKKFTKKIYELDTSRTLFSFLKINKILKKNTKVYDNTIFISNINYVNVLSVIFIKILFRLKLILIERTPLYELKIYYSLIDYIKKNIVKFLMFLLYEKADALVVNSSIAYEEFKKFKKNNLYKIYSPIDLTKKFYFRKKASNKFKIISIGRLEKEKNFRLLIEAFSKLSNNNVHLDIYGEGKLRIELNNLINELDLSQKIKIKKFQRQHEKNYYKYDLYISSSDFEGFPNTVVEAIKNDLPVISTNSKGGVVDILKNGKGGIILKKNDSSELASKINFAIKNINYLKKKQLYAKKNLKNFDIKIYKKLYEKLFLKICEK